MLKLNQYIAAEKQRVRDFRTWWMLSQHLHGKDAFPDACEAGEWDEYLQMFDPAQLAEVRAEMAERQNQT
jgi:hypothetical protein